MNLLKDPTYWKNVQSAYGNLGGKFSAASKGAETVRVPDNSNAWLVAREMAATGKRECKACGVTYEAKPGDVLKHCGKIMAAKMEPEIEKQVRESIGKYKIALKKKADLLPGGKADNKSDKEFPKKELEEGKKHEKKEHTSDSEKAKEIAKDHLVEDKGYYKKLEKVEKKASLTVHFVKDEAKLGNSYWVVKDASADPILKVTLSQAFPGKEATKAAPFSTAAYGEKLLRSVNQRGVEKTVAARDGLNGRAILYKSAQANPMAPDLFQEQTNVEESGNQGQKPVDPQADSAMVDKDTGDEILADKEDHSDVIELLKSAVIPFLVAGNKDITVEQFVQEIRALAQDEDLLSEFQGSLDEMVKNFEHDEDKDEVEDEEKEKEDNAAATEGAQPETGQPPANQQPMLTAQRKMDEKAEDLQRRLAIAEGTSKKLLDVNEQLKREAMKREEEYQRLLSQNKMLMVDRTMRIRHPRCAKLAKMRVEIGEVDDAGKETIALLKMPSGEFDALESRVAKVHARVARQNPDFDTSGMLHFLPEPRGEDVKVASLKSGPRKADERSPALANSWTRPTK
jgi:hypothetical protein